ncbi:MAG: hypothetical protein IPH94_21590 [Saprospiraceae bacterium]|nr:hypothetical protein [Saprospiraceae bacterium]
MKLTMEYHPCPNDTFIFDTIFNQSDLGDLQFDFPHVGCRTTQIALLLRVKFDVTKLSYFAFTQMS